MSILKANAQILNATKLHIVIFQFTFHVPIIPHQEVKFHVQLVIRTYLFCPGWGSYSHYTWVAFCHTNLLRWNVSKLFSLCFQTPSYCQIIFFIYQTSVKSTCIFFLCRLFVKWKENIVERFCFNVTCISPECLIVFQRSI